MNRREALAIAPAFAFAGLTAGATPAPQEETSEIMRLFGEYQAVSQAMEEYAEPDGLTGDELDDLHDKLFYSRQSAIEKKMMSIPSRTAQEFAAKVIIDTNQGGFMDSWEAGVLWKEARQLTGCAL